MGASAANDIVTSILNTFSQLELFPGSGLPSLVPDLREFVLNQLPFIAPYRLVLGQVQILRILHQRTERNQEC
nr:type II toxin-antitoxin system RelE/ParE family toxin [Pseudomonas sp. H3(2019)]